MHSQRTCFCEVPYVGTMTGSSLPLFGQCIDYDVLSLKLRERGDGDRIMQNKKPLPAT